ncbi:DMT family transporter [Pontibacterium sp. N1Y112]|uniref:DMT family transporter n=1 Tax=Pontibacterium sinense TaxID=2781979 RepID=A0A8J7FE43_9GAMM|nr:DMT family transporter [Pontibacterium sinense]MBE9398004.1 DMT family transporter [Pontibacterium sinense]
MHLKPNDPSFLFVLMATIALSFKGILAKFVFAADTDVDFLMLVRFAIAVPLFWIGARVVYGATGGIDGRQWGHCAGTGTLFFLATYFDFTALSYIDAGLSRLILFTFPLFVVLIAALMERRLPTGQHLVAFTVSYSGLLLVVSPQGDTPLSSETLKGIVWALAASVTYAFYLIYSQMILKQLSSSRFTAASNTVTLILVVLFLAGSGRGFTMEYTPEGAGWSVLIATVCTVIPFFLLYEAIKRCGARRASLVSLSGPAITLLFACLLLGETLDATQMLGVAISIAGLCMLEMKSFPTRFPKLVRKRKRC